MMKNLILSCTGIAFLAALIVLGGCRRAEPPQTPDAETTAKDDTAKDDAAKDDKSKADPDNKDDDPQTAGADTKSDDTADGSDAGDPEASSVVTLGDPSLTSGIPGEGDLTVEQIQAWLADDANHEVLQVKLPMGLAAGAGMIKGLDENPLTRAKIELGRQLFFDARLSSDSTISCASCHQPDHGYGAATQFGVGVDGQTGNVNSPVAYNRILSDLQFWDGRAGSLEQQAVGPIANPIEMGNTHEAAVETLSNLEGYRIQFEKVFPEDGVNIDNVGKAIAAFERVLVTQPSPFDYNEVLRAYADYDDEDLQDLKDDSPEEYALYETAKKNAEANPMNDSAKRGRELFFTDKANCSACHVGPNLSDEKYHNLGIGMDVDEPNLGRFGQTKEEKDKGAFKTPTIRNVAVSPPYMHDGSLKTLAEVVEHYVKGGTPNEWLSKDIVELKLTDQDKEDLVAFMEACTGELPPVESARLPKN